MRSRASDYAIDPMRVMAWGGSTGGHLAALAAVSCDAQALEPAETIKLPVAPPPSVYRYVVRNLRLRPGKRYMVRSP
ncbi:MAG: hypothetical protein JO182_00730 [Acidobacteriaceae bacterium]|nr:hypothetical protein [Acidobacteriaceae bacterium]MBV9305932.1 hypothetical protein [Acidobacteriaceae bacterium]